MDSRVPFGLEIADRLFSVRISPLSPSLLLPFPGGGSIANEIFKQLEKIRTLHLFAHGPRIFTTIGRLQTASLTSELLP